MPVTIKTNSLDIGLRIGLMMEVRAKKGMGPSGSLCHG